MALDKTILLSKYVAGDTSPGTILKIQAGGVTQVNTLENVECNTDGDSKRRAFVWNGNFFLPLGIAGNDNLGYAGYHGEGDDYGHILGWGINTLKIVPLGDICLFIGYNVYGYGPTPYCFNTEVGSKSTGDVVDVVLFQDKLIFCGATYSYVWTYPFTGSASSISSDVFYSLEQFKGDAYGLKVISSQYLALYLYNGATWVQQGTNTDTGGATLYGDAKGVEMFEYGNKLWLIAHQTTGQRIRCWEINESTGVFTERDDVVPTLMKGSTAEPQGIVNVLIDDTGTTRKVYVIIFYNYNDNPGWYVYEFNDAAAWNLEQSGSDNIGPYGAVLWDEEAHGAEITGATEVSPGRVDMTINTSNLKDNSVASIDPRYRRAGYAADYPPFHQCTELSGVGSEGKTSLITVPAGIVSLSDLSDDFGDSAINTDLWEKVNYSIYSSSFSHDYGMGYLYNPGDYSINETSGKILFPRGTNTNSNLGVALKNKWWITGAFQIDVELQNLEDLVTTTGDTGYIALYVRVTQNSGYGIIVRKASGPSYLAIPFVFVSGTEAAVKGSAGVHTMSNGEKLRIVRNGSNVWSLIIDPDGANETLTLGSNPTYDLPVQIFLMGMTTSTTHWSLASVPGPGFGPIVVSGAGAVGKYDGSVPHDFSWDAITDLGGAFTGIVNTFVDTNV